MMVMTQGFGVHPNPDSQMAYMYSPGPLLLLVLMTSGSVNSQGGTPTLMPSAAAAAAQPAVHTRPLAVVVLLTCSCCVG